MHEVTTFDMQRMLGDMDNDFTRFSTVANMVTSELPHHVAAMREKLEAGRVEGLEFAARSVAMLFDSLAAQGAADAARNLENAARRRSFDDTSFAFESLEDEIEAVIEELALVLANSN